MTTKTLPTNFQQNFCIFQKLKFLEEHEDIQNIVILDYESLSGKQNDLNDILNLRVLFLRNYFHIIILVDDIRTCIPNTHGRQNCTIIEVSSQFLRKVDDISSHIATQIMMCFSNGLFQMQRCRRAYYCLSEDDDFPDGFQFMECTGYEHVYCSVLRSVQDFLDLQYYFKEDVDDPTKMNVCCLLKNNLSHQRYGDKSGKLMFFVDGEAFFNKTVTFLWKELEKFGNTHHLPVSVTTAFPIVKYKEIQHYPHRTKPLSYRFAIYITDAIEDNILKVLDILRLTQFEGTTWSLKLDKHTEEGRFGSAGDKNVTKAAYKVCKYNIQRVFNSGDNKKYYKIIEDEYMKKLVQEAKEKGLTMKVRYAKILFCGASGAGKTSFADLLKNKKYQVKQCSTGLGDLQQMMMISEKASFEGTNWVDLQPPEEFLQLKLRMYHKLASQTEVLSLQTSDDNTDDVNALSSFAEALLINQSEPDISSKRVIPDVPRVQQEEKTSMRQLESTEVEKRLYSKSPNLNTYQKPSDIWDILTLLDTGGQPQFINMLPAVNSSATITFVVLNMLGGVKHLEERVQVHHYNQDGLKSYEPYPLNYTNKDLIKCLVALLKDSMIRDVSLPDVFVFKKAIDNKPGVCFVGTHLDKIDPQEVDKISEKIEELIKQLEPNDNISIWNLGRLLFAVDNTVAGTETSIENSIADEIRCEVKKIMETKTVYEVPIPWIILELEIRRICNNYKEKKSFLSISEVEMLYEKILPGKSIKSEVKAALRFYHMFGVLLYFHDVPGMNNFVISNPQWLFANLTNLVSCSFDTKIVNHKDLSDFKMKGILTDTLIKQLNTGFLEGIKLEYFLELLKYLKIITPYPSCTSTDYLMLTVLDSFQQEVSHFLQDSSFLQLQGVELLMQLQSGTLPRGIFCCLVVQLIQEKFETWELQVSLNDQRCTYENLVVFCTNFGHYIFLHDKVTHLEVQIRQKESTTRSIHYEVQKSLTQALQGIHFCTSTAVKYGFYCNVCLKPIMKISEEHTNGQKAFPPGLLCDKHGCTELTVSHAIWFKELDVSKVKEVFDEFYSGLVKILPVKNILHQLVPAKVLTPDDIEEIDSLRKSEDKSSYVLAIIDKSLKADITLSFYTLLDIMEKYGGDVGVLAKTIQRDLMMMNQDNINTKNINTCYQKSMSLPIEQTRSVDDSQLLYRCTSEPSSTGSDLSNLISLDELEYLSSKYNVTDVMVDSCMLANVQVLLITTNECEYSAIQSYLRPLSDNTLSKYGQFKAGEHAFYVIGKYGECGSAVRMVYPGSCNITNVLLMASECFPNLGAIFIVGTVTGVSGKANVLDVLVSTDIFTYELTHGTDVNISEKENIKASSLFNELFSQPPKWPKVENRLVNRLKGIKPRLHQGAILCGPDVNEKISELITLYPKAIGIDNDCAMMFTDPHVNMTYHVMCVKCVSDKKGTQPTAALLAADCLEYYLKNPQLPWFLTVNKGKCVEAAAEQHH